MKLYHYTKKEHLSNIKKHGLKLESNYQHLNSDFRQHVIYCWMKPEHDLMGYKNNDDYCLLEIDVDEKYCCVVNMDWISAAYVNKMVYKEIQLQSMNDYIQLYESTSMNLSAYKIGDFRSPEVLVKESISYENIKVMDNCIPDENPNLKTYENHLFHQIHLPIKDDKKLLEGYRSGLIDMLTIHDDSTGILATYRDISNNKMLTIPIDPDNNKRMIDTFFKGCVDELKIGI